MATPLKEMFDAAHMRLIAREVSAVYPGFNRPRFLRLALADLAELNLLDRLHRVAEALHATLPPDFPAALAILHKLAPRIENGFVSLFLPDFVGRHGLSHFLLSMEALRAFTPFGSSEFGVRPFLLNDLSRTLRIMESWARDPDPHVRRLASEGSRPRLPWATRIPALLTSPPPAAAILDRLRSDPSPYVRKSVANHLNDIAKDNPAWVIDRLNTWDRSHPSTAWIAKHALRTLVKDGDRRALALLGADKAPRVSVTGFSASPARLHSGDRLTLTLALASTSPRTQHLVVDYTVHYVKKSGATSPKVFKWKTLDLPPRASVSLAKSQIIRDFSTRKHHPGLHPVTVTANGSRIAKSAFLLEC